MTTIKTINNNMPNNNNNKVYNKPPHFNSIKTFKVKL